MAGGGGDITAAEKETVDSVGALSCRSVKETVVGIGGESKEEAVEVCLVSAVDGESCVVWT